MEDGGRQGREDQDDEDSWEEKSLNDSMRALKPPSTATASAHHQQGQGQGQGRAPSSSSSSSAAAPPPPPHFHFVRDGAGGGGGYSFSDPQADAIANARGFVDPVLHDALKEGGTQRMTVLKIDMEVERFVKDRTRFVFEYDGNTSYHRLIAHKIATHYGIVSRSVEGVKGGDVALLEKPPPPPGEWALAAPTGKGA